MIRWIILIQPLKNVERPASNLETGLSLFNYIVIHIHQTMLILYYSNPIKPGPSDCFDRQHRSATTKWLLITLRSMVQFMGRSQIPTSSLRQIKALATFRTLASKLPYLCRTIFGLPVEPDVVSNKDKH